MKYVGAKGPHIVVRGRRGICSLAEVSRDFFRDKWEPLHQVACMCVYFFDNVKAIATKFGKYLYRKMFIRMAALTSFRSFGHSPNPVGLHSCMPVGLL